MTDQNIEDISPFAHHCEICCEHIKVGITEPAWDLAVRSPTPLLDESNLTEEQTDQIFLDIIDTRMKIILLNLYHTKIIDSELAYEEVIIFNAFGYNLKAFYFRNEEKDLLAIVITTVKEKKPKNHPFLKDINNINKSVNESNLKLLN